MKSLLLGLSLIFGWLWVGSEVAAQEIITVAPFSSLEPGPVPDDWRVSGFRRRPLTEYQLVAEGDSVVLQATSEAAVAGLIREVNQDPQQFPVLSWRWKVGNLLESSDLRRKDGDDYPARVYVIFDYDRRRLSLGTRMKMRMAKLIYGAEIPAAAICYVWDTKSAPGTIVPNAYSDRIQMVVVRSGPDKLNQWVTEERDIVKDYETAFGEPPPAIAGIALATDTDDTGEKAQAWYGDIRLKGRNHTDSR